LCGLLRSGGRQIQQGEILQRVRGIIAATLVGVPLSVFLWFWLHAPKEVAALISIVLGIAIFMIVASRSDAHDEASDVAWREVSPDLPPVSDRLALERDQISMPGPENPAKSGGRTRDGQPSAQRIVASSQGAEPK
jgi:hypothetical protein